MLIIVRMLIRAVWLIYCVKDLSEQFNHRCGLKLFIQSFKAVCLNEMKVCLQINKCLIYLEWIQM